MVGERVREAISRAGHVMQGRDSWGTISTLGEGVPRTLDLEIRVVAIRGGMTIGKIRGRWILGQKWEGIRILGEEEELVNLIVSTAIGMDIFQLPAPPLL
jgi:hypothetical protein